MVIIRSRVARAFVFLAVAACLAPGSALAIQHEVRILLDLDNDLSSGCLVPTVAGPFEGVDQVLITTVETTSPPPAGTVTDVAVSDCIDEATDTFGPPASFDGGWPVGIDSGLGGLDVVETYLPLVSAAVPDPSIVRLALVVTDELGGEQALLTRDGTPGGAPILLDLRPLLEIPTLGEWALILLALLLAAASITLLGRRGATTAFLVVLVLGAGVAWAAPGLDGLISDWFSQDLLASNGMALFGKQAGTDLCFRVDVELLFNTSPTADPQAVTTDEDTPVAITLTGSDPESDPLVFTIVPGSGPDHGTLTGAPPNVTYTPDLDYEGPDGFDFQVEDPSGATDTAAVSITVAPVNDPPVVHPAAFSVAEDAPVGTSVGTATFTDPDAGQSHTFAITAGNTGGAFAIGASTGEITVATPLDFETLAAYALTVEVTDDGAPVLSGSATVDIAVTDADDAPVAVDDSVTVAEDDAATAIDVLANDTDVDGGPKAIASASDPTNGTVVLTGGGPGAHTGLTYEPDPDYCNDPPGTTPDTFTYTLTPGGDVATVSITVTCEDDLPVATDDTATVAEDAAATAIPVLVNDTDVEGDPFTIAGASDPTNGTVVLTGGSPGAHTGLTYQPDPDYCDDPPGTTPDTFTYTLNPGGDSATVSVTVTCVNDAPVANDDAATVAEDAAATAIPVLANDADVEGDPFTIAGAGDPTNGTVVLTGGSPGAHTGLTYQPDPNYCNDPPGTTPDTFTYTLNPGGDTATVVVTVSCIDDAPVAVDDPATVAEDASPTSIDVLLNDLDADGGPKTIASATDPAFGTVAVAGDDLSLSYQPDADYCEIGVTPTAFYRLGDDDPGAADGPANATTVDSAGSLDLSRLGDPAYLTDAPAPISGVNGSDTFSTTFDGAGDAYAAGTVATAATDDFGIEAWVKLDTAAAGLIAYNGSVDLDGWGLYFDGSNYTFQLGGVTQGTGVAHIPGDGWNHFALVRDSGLTTFYVNGVAVETTAAAPLAPTATSGGMQIGGRAGSAADPFDGQIDEVRVFTFPGAYVFAPSDLFLFGNPRSPSDDTFTYDLDPGGDTGLVDVTVTCEDDVTVPSDDTATVEEDAPATLIDVLANDFDPDGGHGITAVSDPANGTAAVVDGGSAVSYQPDPDYCNTPVPPGTADTFTYTVDPGNAVATVSVEVTCQDDAPVAEDDTATVLEDAAATAIPVLTNDTDADADPITISSTSQPTNGTVVLTGGSPGAHAGLTYQPDPNYCNDPPGTTPDTFTYTVNGGDTATVEVTVTCVNDAPAGTNDTVATDEETAYTFAAADFGFTDPDDTPPDTLLAVTVATLPGAGSLTLAGGAVSAGQSIPVAAIDGGDLEFTPAVNGTGTPYASFTFQVQDDGGTADGGVDLDPSANTLSIDVNNINDAPAGTDNTVTTPEDTQYTFAAGDFGFTDPDDSPANALAAVRIITMPGAGSLTLSGGGLVAGTQVPVGDITAGNLRFSPAANGSGSPYATFTFQVRDDGGTANGGVDVDGSANTMTINVTPVNDPPVGTSNTVTTDEDVPYTFTVADFPFSDPNDSPADALVSAIITTLPADGSLTLGGAGLVSGTEVTAASITGGQLQFVSDLNEFGTPYTSFTFQVRDDGGTANGGVDLDATPRTLTINVNPVNDPPTFTDATIDYTTAGNTQLRAGEAATGASVTHEQDNLDIGEKSGPSDVDGPGPPFAYSLASGPANGQATVSSDGTFTYEPNAGFHGPTDSFMVNVSDGGTPAGIGVVTVTVTISEMVWYVHDVTGANNPAAGDTGRSTNAFDSIAELVAANPITPDDYVFVFAGNTAGTPHSTELVIDDSGVKLRGEGVGLTVPGVGTLVPAGVKPRWVVTADNAGEDNAVTVDATAGSLAGVEIRGLDLTGRDNGIDVTATGANNAGVTISDNTIASDATTGLEGVDVNAAGTGTVTLAFSDNALNARGSALDFTRTAGTAFVTAFHDNVVSGDSQGAGLVVAGPVTFDTTPGGAIQPVPGGTTVIGQPGNRVGGAGLSLTSVTGALNFANLASGSMGAGDLDVFTDSGAALSVSGVGGFDLDVTPNAGVLVANAGPAAILSGLDANLVLNLLTSTNSGSQGVSLTSVTGTVSAPSGSSISNASSTDFAISGSSAAVTYGGTITDDVGQLVSVSSSGGSPKLFTGAITDGDDGDGGGISLSGNSSTIRFSGGVVLSTGGNAAFAATGGGTVEVCDENPCNPGATGINVNKITTTTGTALNVANTTIGANNLEFRSVSAGTGASGPASGIVLNNTGSAGGLKVKGTGAAGSGGTIQRTGGVGILLTSTQHVSLSSLNVQNAGDDGIRGQGVHNFELIGSNLTTNGNATAENGLQFGEATGSVAGITGTLTLTNTNITGSAGNNVHIRNTSGTLAAMSVSGSTFNDLNDVTGANSFLFEMSGTATTTAASITGSTFSNNSPQRALEVQAHQDGTISDFTVSGTNFNENGIHASFTQDTTADLTFSMLNNTSMLNANPLQAINVFSSSTSTGGSITGTIQGNSIGTAATPGSTTGPAIAVTIQGRTVATLLIDDNVIRNLPNGNRGMDLQFLGPTAGGQPITQSDVTITGNDVDTMAPAASFPLAAIFLGADDQGSPARVRANVTGNTAVNSVGGGSFDYPTFDGNGAYLVFVEVGGAAEGQLVDTAPASANATAQLTSTNTGTVFTQGITLIPGPISTP